MIWQGPEAGKLLATSGLYAVFDGIADHVPDSLVGGEQHFKVHLNKYNVIFLDIQWMYGNALEEMKRNQRKKPED